MFSSCRSKIIEYKWLLILLISYFVILILCSPLDITQLAGGDKCFAHLYSAVTGIQIYPAPTYSLISWLVARLPLSDGFSLSFFMSIIPAVGCVACVYFAIKKQTDIKNAPIVGALCLASSWVFTIQALKVEIYPLAAFFAILGYVFIVYKKGTLAAITFGFALSSHWMIAVPAVFAWFIYSREFRRKSYWCVIVYVIMHVIWSSLPQYASDLGYNNITQSMSLLVLWWGYGSISDFFGNFSRIPIAIFIMSFGWISALLYFKRDFRKSVPIIFTVSVPILYLFIAMADSGYQQISAIVPFLAVASGLGWIYISDINLKRRIIYGLVILLIASPIILNIDTNPTTARSMINQLSDVQDNSIIICYRQYHGENDTFGRSVSWMVDYYNLENDKHLYPLVVEYLWYPYADEKQEIIDHGITIPNFNMCNESINNYSKMIDNVVACNPKLNFYYYEITDTEHMQCELRKW